MTPEERAESFVAKCNYSVPWACMDCAVDAIRDAEREADKAAEARTWEEAFEIVEAWAEKSQNDDVCDLAEILGSVPRPHGKIDDGGIVDSVDGDCRHRDVWGPVGDVSGGRGKG